MQDCTHLIAPFLVKTRYLETERPQEDMGTSTRFGFSFCCLEQLRPDALSL